MFVIGSIDRLTGFLYATLAVCFGRISFITKYISFDRLTRWHHYHTIPAMTFIILHFVFLTLSYAQLSRSTFWTQQLKFLRFDEILGAYVALILFLLIAGFSFLFSFIKIKYEYWYFVHLFVYVAALASFGHQMELGGDFRSLLFSAFWVGFGLVVLILFVWYRFLAPARLFLHHQFIVNKIIKESDNCYSIYIGGRNIDNFRYRAGQFAAFRFLTKDFWLQSHPFSISSAPGQKEFRITIKNLGDYTKRLITKLKPGTQVIVEGPHGQFVFNDNVKRAVMIAGGIGITPILSLLGSIKDKGIETHCFFSIKAQGELIFKDELSSSGAVVHYHASDDLGRLTLDTIKQSVSAFRDYHYYICGHEKMIKFFRDQLMTAGVAKDKIHYELFSY
ncbi:hypothetical protein COT97_05225 [Candidatus Falkowbacteria bacterium CG10_big_fil_rev_8_21_14_0_10_39_11]|uniref:FAD-binding FR-type domain-containing protein n=1 Tax=Candidatus Falkowbacteria bacterium CG10_big_fil_rev_8_21_14_0_10_39_11 TaxID=1974565 RepID=A0A2H0V5N0_9BACT|nr:MAG: hypothetical protein COT97_05225 [Candidatus Falkowbacteria bacterium CG10_big_fil_rev_8_21_14_0_10_39_11]